MFDLFVFGFVALVCAGVFPVSSGCLARVMCLTSVGFVEGFGSHSTSFVSRKPAGWDCVFSHFSHGVRVLSRVFCGSSY